MTKNLRVPPIKPVSAKKETLRAEAVFNPFLDDEQALAKRLGLRQWMKEQRLCATPKLTQMGLSQVLDFTYSIVTAWENGVRIVTESHFRAWGAALGLSEAVLQEQIAQAGPAIQPDSKLGISTGSRMDASVNARLKWLRAELRLTLREFGDATGISAGHMQRIENNVSNLSIGQLRSVHHKLQVNYEWLIDGIGTYDRSAQLAELIRLRRENELLESLRQAQSMSVR